MRYRSVVVSLLVLFLILGGWTVAQAQSSDSSDGETVEAAVERVRALYFQRDFARGHRRGKKFLDQFPESHRLRAWTLMLQALDTNLLLSREEEVEKEALAAADSLKRAHPENPWSWFALAGTARLLDQREEEALEYSKQALRRAPDHPDLLWLRAKVLANLERNEEVVSFVEKHTSRVDNPAPLLTLKGRALTDMAGSSDEVTLEEAFAAYEEARRIDSSYVRAFYYPGIHLLRRQNQHADAYPLLKDAAQLAPTSYDVHEDYWRAIIGLSDRSNEEKVAEIEEDVEALLERRDEDTPALYTATAAFSELGADEKTETYRDRILAEAPTSVEAEWTRVNRYRDFRRTHSDSLQTDSTLRAQFRRMLTDFIDRSHHHNMELVGGAYRNLFRLAQQDSTVSDDRLLEIVNGMVQHETANPDLVYAEAPIVLANRTSHYDRAREIARLGLEKLPEEIRSDSAFVDTEQEFQRRLDWASQTAHDALGWVHFQAGDTVAAEKHLQKAHELDQKHEQSHDVENLYHLGQFYEAQGQLDEAETFYVLGKGEQTMGENPNDAAVKALYEKRHGSLDGYDEYIASVEDRLRGERKQKVLAQRIEDPAPLPSFTLETLAGDTLSSDELEGSVAVINVWGKWCGPCVQEMPDIQKLYEKYRSVDDVRVLTINNDDNPNEVRKWMKEHEYTFPVLLDDGYLGKNDVRAFPTTWFTTASDSRIAFEKEGYTDALVEEFSWRVEALRSEDEGV